MSFTSNYRVTKPKRRAQTCDMCKSRHQKCSGAQPCCNNCELRGISCSYSNLQANPSDQAVLPSAVANSRPPISDAEYDRLYSKIFGDIVRRLNLEANQNPRIHGEGPVHSRTCHASLPSFYQEVSTIVKEEVISDSQQTSPQTNSNVPITNQATQPALERNLEHVRKILRDSLPSQEVSQRLLDLFLEYQNSVFYVCNRNEVQQQLDLMFEDPDRVTISWFCQMFLIFAVGVQFDDVDDAGGAPYHEIGQKYIDDAIDENPQNTLWVMRAMLLLCFYQPPTKWTSIWIYLDAAIRGAQRFQLDLGDNLLKELSDEEYQEWRQLWLTIISFDRWVAIFLGRLPRIKESISRDPIFKGLHLESSLDCCAMQNNVTGLAIIAGYILRDMYFSEQFSLSVCQQRKNELQMWMANLPNPLRQQLESGVFLDLPEGQAEAAFNLHFMQLGTWMLLTRPSLLKTAKMTTSATNSAGTIVSAILSDARVCIDYASRLINSATTMLFVSLPPKRSFMPLFFLVNAAHIMILGAVWKLKRSKKGYRSLVSYEPSHELAAIDASTRVLDYCGQRNAFARKYLVLIKDLRQQLNKGLPTAVGNVTSTSSSATCANSLNSPPSNFYLTGSSSFPANLESMTESQVFQNLGAPARQNSISTSPLSDGDMSRGYHSSVGSLDASIDPWSEQFGIFYPSNDASPYDPTALLRGSDQQDTLENMLE